jgi:hypothetical protein
VSTHQKKRHGPGQRDSFLKIHWEEAVVEVNEEYCIIRGWHSRNPDARDPHDPRRREVCRTADLKLLLQFSIDDYHTTRPPWIADSEYYLPLPPGMDGLRRWVEEAQP